MDASHFLFVVSRPWPGEAQIMIFASGLRLYALSCPENRVGSELCNLARQYRAQGQVAVTVDRRKLPR